ncbi:sensor histidine kinase [Micromonospora sp. NPDC047738]|uniref:sensor histidine kinase n=1 Tax=Micromonospora sp. NPDC047738 TaxID=3155741 RepID=UPI0033C830C7
MGVSVDARPSLQGAGEGAGRLWDAYFAAVFALTLAAVALSEASAARRWLAAITLGAIATLYLAYGRGLARRGTIDSRAGGFLAAVLVLFLVALTGAAPSSFLLFAICPLVFRMLPMWPAAAVTTLANALPAIVAIQREGFAGQLHTHLLPMAVGGAILSLGLGLWIREVVRRSRERADLIVQLEQSRAEVARLSHQAGVAAERARLAGEIHDTLAQGFTSIIALLQAAGSDLDDLESNPDGDRARHRIDVAVRTARESLAESRALVAALAPVALDAGPLDEAVRDLVARLGEQTLIRASYRLSGTVRPLPTAVEVVLLRAAQEALANVRRHSFASEVSVTLGYKPDAIRLVVADDGRGFDPASASGGFGLRSIRARTDEVGGTLTVQSGRDADQGTTLTLEVPQ